jgi:hemerythrin superfamily protein
VTTTESTSGQGTDVVQLLTAQHEEIKNLFRAVGEASGEARREPFECLVRLLAVHETAEEEVVYPALRAAGAGAVADARIAEEQEAKRTLADLEKLGPTGDNFLPGFDQLRDAVVSHAENEEREVFPVLRSKELAGQLEAMGTAVKAAEAMAPTHPHPHVPGTATANLVAGPMAAIVDRVRDAIRDHRR